MLLCKHLSTVFELEGSWLPLGIEEIVDVIISH
jgi:hypothetical protein